MVVEGISREEFEQAYARRSGVALEWLLQHRHAVPCDCGDELCEGWAMVPLEWADWRGRRHAPTLRPCGRCDQPVMWAQLSSGRPTALDPDPIESLEAPGWVIESRNPDGSGARRARYVVRGERAGEPRYVGHWETCPGPWRATGGRV